MRDDAVDIAIVGGGAAAASAALTLAGTGYRVAAIAPRLEPGDRAGESLAASGVELLAGLGLAEAFAAGPHRPANARFSAWGSALLAQSNPMPHAGGLAYVLDRPAFDRMLRDAVERTGCAIDATVERARRCDDGWTLHLAGGARVRARFAIDCSGRAAVVARGVGVRRRADRMVAAYAFLRQAGSDIDPTPATMIEAVEDGWWYATLLPDLRLCLAFFSDPDRLPRGITRDARAWAQMVAGAPSIARWLESAEYAIVEPPRLASAATTWLEPVAGDGWAAAGDAAAAFDPLSSHGLTTALWSGRRAALAAAAMLDGDDRPLAHYAEDFGAAIEAVLAARSSVYSRERRFGGAPFWTRRSIAPSTS